jgi:hypothetical protein
MDVLNNSADDFDLQLAQSIIDRDNSLTESGCGSDQDLSGDEDDGAPGEAVGGVPDGAASGAVVPCSACLPQLHSDPLAARRHMMELEDKLHRADALGIPLFMRWHFRQCKVAHYRGRGV